MEMTAGLLQTGHHDNFRFESTDHGKSVLAGLQHLREMQQLFDVTLVAESREFPAHRVVLASCSDYFRAMFTDGLRECTQSRISLNGLTASSTAHLIDFAYNSTINIDSDNVVDVLAGATHVQILPVITACENYLRNHLSLDNCVNTARVAELFSLQNLQQHVFNFICRNWATFSMSESFYLVSAQFLVSLLSSGYPMNCKESDVLMSLLSWCSYSSEERVPDMSEVMECILFENISGQEILEVMDSKEWFELVESQPNIVAQIPALAKLKRQSMGWYSESRDDNIISMADFSLMTHSPVLVTKIEVRTPRKHLDRKHKIPGLINTRGFSPTIVVAGGFSQDQGMTNNVMFVDSYSGQLKHLTKIPHLDQINFGVAVFNNQLYVVGGCFNDQMQEISIPFGFRYNPLLDEWRSIAPMSQERCRFLLCSTEDKIYAIGGDPSASNVSNEDLAQCEVYNPRTNEWKPMCPLPGNRSQLAGASLGKTLFVSGGIQEVEEQVLQDFYQYEPRSDIWERKPDMLTPRTDHSMFIWEGNVYVIGGWYLDPVTNRRVMATTIDCFDFETGRWEVVGTLNQVRTYATYTLQNDRVFVIGGWHKGNYVTKCRTIDIFDLRNQTWSQGQDQNIALWEHGACTMHLPKFVPSSNS